MWVLHIVRKGSVAFAKDRTICGPHPNNLSYGRTGERADSQGPRGNLALPE